MSVKNENAITNKGGELLSLFIYNLIQLHFLPDYELNLKI